jgi:hypothetical protein
LLPPQNERAPKVDFYHKSTFGAKLANMFDDMMNDRIIVTVKDGRKFTDIAASVQGNKVFTERTDIPIQPGDKFTRSIPSGVVETYLVEDPGFHSGGGGLPDTYQMKVRRI